MQEHPNATLIREMIDDPVRSEVDFVTDDVEWHFIGPIPTLHSKAELEARMAGGGSGPEYQQVGQSTHDVLANDEHAVALLETTFRKGDETLTYRTVEIYHLRDGKISARWAFSDDTQAINRFFGS
jgi:ketosteroid isomerase-like protein